VAYKLTWAFIPMSFRLNNKNLDLTDFLMFEVVGRPWAFNGKSQLGERTAKPIKCLV
jgi:hypothetical protein